MASLEGVWTQVRLKESLGSRRVPLLEKDLRRQLNGAKTSTSEKIENCSAKEVLRNIPKRLPSHATFAKV
jgi:hypothetical protein